MPSTRPSRPASLLPLLGWGAFVAGGIAIGMYAELPMGRAVRGSGRSIPRLPAPTTDLDVLLHQLGIGSITWFAVVAIAPLLVWGARRLDFDQSRHKAVVIIALTLIGLMSASALVDYVTTFPAEFGRPPFVSFLPMAARQHVLPWVAVAGIVAVLEGRRRARNASIERERLRAEAAEQRLVALSSQLQPHFLFNTLQGISTLIHRDPKAADEMLTRLSDLLRDVLQNRDRTRVPLSSEVRYAQTYLEIAQIRFGQRLTFAIDVPDDASRASVPLFILQPLIENALKHGVGAQIRGGHIVLRARRTDNRLVLEITDNGPGFGSATPAERVGLGNTRERLNAAFPRNHRLAFRSPHDGAAGAVVQIDMPYEESSDPPVSWAS